MRSGEDEVEELDDSMLGLEEPKSIVEGGDGRPGRMSGRGVGGLLGARRARRFWPSEVGVGAEASGERRLKVHLKE